MEHIKVKIFILLITFSSSSCEKFEMRGFFTTFEDVNNRFEQSMEWNSRNGYSEITSSQQSYTLSVMADSHVGGTENLDRFFKDARDQNITAVVMAGDLTTGHKEDYDIFLDKLRLQDSLWIFPVVGNHDLYFEGWKHFYPSLGSSTYFFIVSTPSSRDLFICLDTGNGTLGSKQLEWFKNLLETSRNRYRYCIVFTHNNLFRLRPTTSTNPMIEENHVFSDIFLRYNVNMVVTGHDHKRNTDILGKTTHIIMDALQDTNDNASYLRLTIEEQDIIYSFVDL